MRISLARKLAGSFLLVAVTATALLALSIRLNSSTLLSRLLEDQSRNELKTKLIEYYRSHGSLVGVVDEQSAASPQPPANEDKKPPVRSTASNTPQPQPQSQMHRFGLADVNGVVIWQLYREYPIGKTLPDHMLDKGEPIEIDGQVIGTILTLPEPPEFSMAERAFLTRVNQSLLLAASGAVLVALLIGVILARSLTSPLIALTSATNRISAGELEQAVPVQSRDEIGELANAFNQMSQAVARANRLRRQLTADIAHDLRTPLSIVSGYIESMRDGILEATPERLNVIYNEIEHLQCLVSDLRTLAQSDAGELTLDKHPLAPADLLQKTAAAYQHQAAQKGILLQVNAPAELPIIYADETRLSQVMGNLIANALRFTSQGGHINLQASLDGNRVILTIEDDGVGIDPQDLPNIFSRLYRGDKARSGSEGESGLGLAIAKALVEAQGGRISAESTLGKGAKIILQIPAATE